MTHAEREFWKEYFDGYDHDGEPEGTGSPDDFEVLSCTINTMEALVTIQAKIVETFMDLDGVVREGEGRFMAHRDGVQTYGETPYLAICNLMLQLRTLH